MPNKGKTYGFRTAGKLSADVTAAHFACFLRHTRIAEPGTAGTHTAQMGNSQPTGGAAVMNDRPKARRGFASMSPDKQREIASKGGRAAHAKGTAHEWSSGEARDAGRKGGMVSRGGRGKLPESPQPSEAA
jgi:general stress protein YciG